MSRMILMAAAIALGASAGGAQADTLTDRIRSDLESQGYKDIEIDRDDGRIEVEAVRGNQEVELVYDGDSGELVSRDDNRTTGLERAEQVSGKELPASGQNGREDDDRDDDGNEGHGGDRGGDRGSEGRGNGNGGEGNGGGNGNGRD